MNIYGLTLEMLEEYFVNELGSKKFHADQLFSWLYERRIHDYSEITNIKKELLDRVSKEYSINRLKIVNVEKDTDVCKYLFELNNTLAEIVDIKFICKRNLKYKNELISYINSFDKNNYINFK